MGLLGVSGRKRASGMPRRKKVDLDYDKHGLLHRRRLDNAWEKFDSWCREKGHDHVAAALHAHQMNALLKSFVQWLYDAEFAVYHGRHAILAVQRKYPQLRGSLGPSWEVFAHWEMREPHASRRPLPLRFLKALVRLATALALDALGPARLEWLELAIFLHLCFRGLLRPCEGLKLRTSCVKVIFGKNGWPRQVLVRVLNPKNKRSLGKQQMVLIKSKSLACWVYWWICVTRGSAKFMFDASYVLMMARFKKLQKMLGFDSLFTLGSLRAGGATALFIKTRNAGWVRFMGRWSSERTLTHYIQEAMSAYVTVNVAPLSDQKVDAVNRELKCFDYPSAFC